MGCGWDSGGVINVFLLNLFFCVLLFFSVVTHFEMHFLSTKCYINKDCYNYNFLLRTFSVFNSHRAS